MLLLKSALNENVYVVKILWTIHLCICFIFLCFELVMFNQNIISGPSDGPSIIHPCKFTFGCQFWVQHPHLKFQSTEENNCPCLYFIVTLRCGPIREKVSFISMFFLFPVMLCANYCSNFCWTVNNQPKVHPVNIKISIFKEWV